MNGDVSVLRSIDISFFYDWGCQCNERNTLTIGIEGARLRVRARGSDPETSLPAPTELHTDGGGRTRPLAMHTRPWPATSLRPG